MFSSVLGLGVPPPRPESVRPESVFTLGQSPRPALERLKITTIKVEIVRIMSDVHAYLSLELFGGGAITRCGVATTGSVEECGLHLAKAIEGTLPTEGGCFSFPARKPIADYYSCIVYS